MQTVICKLSSWIIAHFSLNSGIHLMSQEYTCFTEKSYANQTKFTMLPFLYKKANRLKNEISQQFGYTYSQLQVVFCQPCWSDQFHYVMHHPRFPTQQSLVQRWICDFSFYSISYQHHHHSFHIIYENPTIPVGIALGRTCIHSANS